MIVDDALVGVSSLYIETSPFIYFVEQHPSYVKRIRAVFQFVDAGTLQVITSAITLTEVLTMPIKMGQQGYLQDYREMLLNTESIMLVSVNAAIAEQAAHLRAKYGLRTPDALHIATALVSGCNAFLTNDLALKRVSELKILVVDELQARDD